jgi:hypothetical protein
LALSLSPAPQPDAAGAPRITVRAIAIGALCVVFLAWGGHFTRHIGHTTKMGQDHLPWDAVVPLLLLAVGVNKLLQKLRPSWMFTRHELMLVFGMALIASALPAYFMGHLIANVAAPFYFASVENRWAEFIQPHLPPWAVVSDPVANRWFFEGKPPGAPTPWEPWIVPLFWRLSLVVVIGFLGFCLVALFRKQWVENERLGFPLMALPTALVDPEPRGFFTAGLFNRPLFWVGFGLSIFPIAWNIIGYFEPLFPTIPNQFPAVQFGRDYPPIELRTYPLIIGVSYFMELDVSFTLLISHLFLTLQMGLFTRIGADIGPTMGGDSADFELWQGFGALCVIVPFSIYMARGHLSRVVRKALGRGRDVDDTGEFLSYRTAVLGLLASSLFIAGWCVAAGMGIGVTLIFLAFLVVIWIGITRMSIEGGLISTRTIQAQDVTYHVVGPVNIPARGMVGFALTETWHHDLKTILLADLANASRLFQDFRTERRRLLFAIGLSLVLVSVISALYQVSSSYQTGAFNYGGIYGPFVQSTFNTITTHIRDPFALKRYRALVALIGAATTAALLAARYVWPAFPLHPIGFAAATSYPPNRIAFSIFWAWAAKALLLRLGGIRAYRSGAFFFHGLIVGYFSGVAVSFLIDCIWFPGEGHSLALY